MRDLQWIIADNAAAQATHDNSTEPEAPYLAQAKRIATMYNEIAQAESRPDLEEEKQ